MKTSKKITNRLLPFALAGALMLMGMGCEEEKSQTAPIEVNVQLLDTLLNEKQFFNVGEDIVFKYTIKNKGNDRLVWYLSSEFNLHEIFSVYEIIPPNNENNQTSYNRIGTPQSGVFNVDFKKGHTIPSNGTLEFKMSWLGDEKFTTFFYNWDAFPNVNNQLSVGDYMVEFDQVIDIAGHNQHNVNIKNPFSVIVNN